MKKEGICNLIIIDPQNDFVDPNGSLYMLVMHAKKH